MHRHASLNRIYRLVWSHVQQGWVVVSETSRGRVKGSRRRLLLAAATLVTAHLAQAGPTGGQVTAGSGQIAQSGSTTTVNQGSQNLSLSWQSFNTNAAETVNFVQPSSSAIAVNRILDSNATQFMGKLNANGQVFVINPNGVVFGAGAQVNVGGLVASTLDIDDREIGGATRRFVGTGTGSIANHGSISAAEGGYVAFVGNKVGNQGSINAAGGAVALGAGSDVTLSFAGNRLVNMQVNQSTLDNLAENGGLVRADGGAVLLSAGARDAVLASVVNNSGVIVARGVSQVGGTIVLEGGAQGSVTNAGTLDASSREAGAVGGTVKVLGEQVALAAGSRIDVSGREGGGTAYVGGNFLGAGPERNAQNTAVAAGSSILADAIDSGDGGKVAVWSDGVTQFHGAISARGGAQSGNGGEVETSGAKLKVGQAASVGTSAPNGRGGNWLLDPADITIGSAAVFGNEIDVDSAALTDALNQGNVTIKTSRNGSAGAGDLILLDTIGNVVRSYDPDTTAHFAKWTENDHTLTLSAHRDIRLKYTPDVATPQGNLSFGGGIDVAGTANAGRVKFHADNSATGTGKVYRDNVDWNTFALGSNSQVSVYYTPGDYLAPTDYSQYILPPSGDVSFGNPSQVSSYMAINLVATIDNKTYDGKRSAELTGLGVGQRLPDDIAISIGSASAEFADKNAGVDKAVMLGGIVFAGVGGGSTEIARGGNNYYLNGLDSHTATIGKRAVQLTDISANNKIYNGTATATLAGTARLLDALADDSVGVAGSGAGSTFANKNAGAGKAVTVRGYALTGDDAGNYELVAPTGLTATIGKAQISVTGITANNKTYDGTPAATLSGTAIVTPFSGDVAWIGGTGSASFSDRSAGTGKAVAVTGYTLGGTDSGNYNLVQPGGLTADIRQAGLVLNGVAVADKVYDGTTAAALSGNASVAAIGADQVSVSGSGTARFADKNVGAGKAVVVEGFTLSGDDAGNYTILPSGGLSATISKANLDLQGLTAHAKTYDGGTGATLSGQPTVKPLGGDVVTLSGSGYGVFADRNAGSGKAVTVSGYVLGGLDGANYNLRSQIGLNADILRDDVQVRGINAANKTYDGTTGTLLYGSAYVTGRGGDQLIVGGSGVASFIDKNAGTGKAVVVSGYTLGGADAGNYNLVQPSGLSADIGRAGLELRGLSVANKVYDATPAATLMGTASVRALGADQVSVSGSGTATFADKHAGVGKSVVVSGYALSGDDAGNYTLLPAGGLSATIAKANLALGGVTALDKTYDGGTAAWLTGSASVTALSGDVVQVAGSGSGAFVDKNAGSGKAVSVSGYTLAGRDAGNYSLVSPSDLTANITPANLSVTGVTAMDKTYDAGLAAVLSGTASVHAFGGDQVSVGGSASATFSDKNVGEGKAVAVSGFTLAGDDAGNYRVVQPTGLSANITRAGLALQGLGVADKVYDGTRAATLTGSASVRALGEDRVSVSGSGTASFADKNAGVGKAVELSGFALSGDDAGNYELLPSGGLSATIGRADLFLSGLSAANRTYDGTTAAALSGVASIAPIDGDLVTLGGVGVGAFADKNVASAKSVTVSGYTLSGADAGNYNVVGPADLRADITKADVSVSGVRASSKTYDGAAAATLTGAATVAVLGSDQVALGGTASATFADRNVGTGKAVAVSGYTLEGADAGNYNLLQPTGLSADIGKASLAVQGLSALDKVYDATTAATLSGTASVRGFGADQLSLGGSATASFADKNAGTGKAVAVSGYTLGGADAGNYELVQPTGLSADIGKASLALQGLSAADKTYDGTTAASLAGRATVRGLGIDQLGVGGNGTASFADRNAGAGKAVAVSGFTLQGADAGNYELVQPSGLSASIGKASLNVSGIVARDKVFDGTTDAAVDTSGVRFEGIFGSDQLAVASIGAFDTAAVGVGKTVNLRNSYGGADIGNYVIVGDQTTALATIAAAPVVTPPPPPPVPPVQPVPPEPPQPPVQPVPSEPQQPPVQPAPPEPQQPPVPPVTPGNPGLAPTPESLAPALNEVRTILAQMQSLLMPMQAGSRPGALGQPSTLQLSSADGEPAAGEETGEGIRAPSIITTVGTGPSAPRLRIQGGGMQLPQLASAIAE